MCPLRVFIFLFSALILMYFSFKWVLYDTPVGNAQPADEDPVQSKQSAVSDCAFLSIAYVYSLFYVGSGDHHPSRYPALSPSFRVFHGLSRGLFGCHGPLLCDLMEVIIDF